MRLLVRHGINGKEELAIQVVGDAPAGWEIMKQLAWKLDLESPFQIIFYLNSTAAILSPVRVISSHMASKDLEICYLIQSLISRGKFQMADIPALCSHLQSFEIMTLMHMRIRLPETCGSPGLGSA